MTDRQTLKALGLRESELRNIRYVNREFNDSMGEIESALLSEGREYSLPSIDYRMVRERLEARGLSGKEARAYTQNLLSDLMSELVSIWETGHTSAFVETYKPFADYYDMTVDDFYNLSYSDKVGYLKSALYALMGKYHEGSDVADLLREFNDIVGADNEEEE